MTDPDAGDTLGFAIVGGADAGLFATDENTGALTFLTAPDFEASGDNGGDNIYDVTVEGSDGNGGADTQALAVTVTNDNEAPSITSNRGEATAALSVENRMAALPDSLMRFCQAPQQFLLDIALKGPAARFRMNDETFLVLSDPTSVHAVLNGKLDDFRRGPRSKFPAPRGATGSLPSKGAAGPNSTRSSRPCSHAGASAYSNLSSQSS